MIGLKRLNILVACEESQRVCIAFRNRGHRAFSCDIIPCSGGHPEWHIQQDVTPLLNGRCVFSTADGNIHRIDCKWDLIIAHPPCTYLTVTGNRWYDIEKYGQKAIDRIRLREEAVSFFFLIWNADCESVVIENPVGIMSTRFRKPDQIIQPWQFATDQDELVEKSTCLWMRGVNPLIPRRYIKPDIPYVEFKTKEGAIKRQSLWYYTNRCMPKSQRARLASVTFNGVSTAMSEQWG